MNTFGRLLRTHILGESHGELVGVVLDGVPAGIALAPEDFRPALERRRGGSQRGTTPRREPDEPLLRSGVRDGVTTGAPLLIELANTSVRSKDYADVRRVPRPGHADLVAQERFAGHQDHRGGGHFSGRLTAGLVVAGVVAAKVAGVTPRARVVSAGGSTDVAAAVDAALAEGDSVGGIVECVCDGVPLGLGEPFFDSLESTLAHLAFAIPAVKGVEFGAGFAAAAMRGSQHNDRFVDVAGTTATNHAGGINGGLSNGNPLVWRVAVKPTSSIRVPQRTIDRATGELTDLVVTGRHDACIALRVPPILEAVTSLALADALLVHRALTPQA